MYKSPNNIFGEVRSGSSYKHIYTTTHANHTSNLSLLVVTICFWGDATHIYTVGRFKFGSWNFSPLIFKEKVRHNNKFWGMLGYVKDLNTTSAQKDFKIGDTICMYHKQLLEIFASFTRHEQQLKNIATPFGKKTT